MSGPVNQSQNAARKLGIPLDEYDARREAGERWCGRCRKWLPDDAFSRNRSRPDGRAQRCKPCARDSKRTTYRRRAVTEHLQEEIKRIPAQPTLDRVHRILSLARGHQLPFSRAWAMATTRLPEEWRVPLADTRGSWQRAYDGVDATPGDDAATYLFAALHGAQDDSERLGREPVHTPRTARG